jgi:hypothetical protein
LITDAGEIFASEALSKMRGSLIFWSAIPIPCGTPFVGAVRFNRP